ncbi:hypothetical protein Q73_13485 [Bacillus coahuilensis m2-6]|uniref:hypothetical protein n=1 Tax=Bacillus coahuilensis TaxID=408580 RepID=UPI000750200B|nr:hypothetical protein [Bacillus coahuilensis]KUP05274.1 hypothetical protein Q73_13485 [Bacillus coahuilensis m2-6]
MKIMLHGATSGTNFGDYLFASIFFDRINQVNNNGENLFLEAPKIGISNFFKNELKYTKKSW